MACISLPRGLLHSTSRSTSSAWPQRRSSAPTCLVVRAGVVAPEEEAEKEVSVEWKAAESTQTFPPTNKKKWTGYVEKDTAGQTNIYAVEPTVYVSENVISSNTAGDSPAGSEQTLLVAGGLALALVLGAALVLNSSSPTPLPSSSDSYTGPTLSYYIQKFTPTPPAPTIMSFEAPSPDSQLQSE